MAALGLSKEVCHLPVTVQLWPHTHTPVGVLCTLSVKLGLLRKRRGREVVTGWRKVPGFSCYSQRQLALGRADHITGEDRHKGLTRRSARGLQRKESRDHAVSYATTELPAEEITLFENKSFQSCSSIESTCKYRVRA